MPPDGHLWAFHATCVAFSGRAVLLTGASGSGKSATGLALLAMGGGLVADDRVDLHRQGAALIASRPSSLPALIEARQIGLIPAAGPTSAAVALVADLAPADPARLPETRTFTLLGVSLPLIRIGGLWHGPAAVRQYILAGIQDGFTGPL
jgi:HPr kinase/phosphorylase